MLAYTHSGVYYRRRTLSLGDSPWKQACSCPRGMLPCSSRILATNTTLRKGLGKEGPGLCGVGTRGQGDIQGCSGLVCILSLKSSAVEISDKVQLCLLRVFIKSGSVLYSCRIDHTSPTVIYIEEKPEPQLFSLW